MAYSLVAELDARNIPLKSNNMKRSISIIVFVLASSATILASSGSALLPYWHKDSATPMSSSLHITNITDSAVVVYLNLSNFDGSDYNESTEATITNFVVSNAQGDPFSTSGMTIAPGATAIININGGNLKYGHGLIEWDSSGSHPHSLVAFVRWEGMTGGNFTRTIFPVNDLKPF